MACRIRTQGRFLPFVVLVVSAMIGLPSAKAEPARMYGEAEGLIISEVTYGFGEELGGVFDEYLYWSEHGLRIAKYQIQRDDSGRGTKNLVILRDQGGSVTVEAVRHVKLEDGTVNEDPPYPAAEVIESLEGEQLAGMAMAMLELSDRFEPTGEVRTTASGRECELWLASDVGVETCVWQGLPLESSSPRNEGVFWQEKIATSVRLGPVDPSHFDPVDGLTNPR